ncbi:MAG TPA: hypothetical protein VG672_24475 [Bryobacteraceae bacterium]|nr:hypothetical protein [Bryobacteraceae bacterium]
MNNDPALRSLLRTWHAEPPAQPGFQNAVWDRIALAGESRLSRLLRRSSDWFLISLPRPAYASALILACVLGGVAVAQKAVAKTEAARETTMRERYLASIDPITMAGRDPRYR